MNQEGINRINELSRKSKELFELKEGTLYPILHALEQKNYIISYWDETGAKKRKYYSITKDGKKHLKEKKEEWECFSMGINQVLGGVLFGY